MLGIPEGGVTLDYCCKLMMEYTALDSAQLYLLLKRFSPYSRKKRMQLCRTLCHTQYARQISANGRNYFILRPGIKIEGRLKQQICCFWILLDYIDKVDRHFATGTPGSLISMEFGGAGLHRPLRPAVQRKAVQLSNGAGWRDPLFHFGGGPVPDPADQGRADPRLCHAG